MPARGVCLAWRRRGQRPCMQVLTPAPPCMAETRVQRRGEHLHARHGGDEGTARRPMRSRGRHAGAARSTATGVRIGRGRLYFGLGRSGALAEGASTLVWAGVRFTILRRESRRLRWGCARVEPRARGVQHGHARGVCVRSLCAITACPRAACGRERRVACTVTRCSVEAQAPLARHMPPAERRARTAGASRASHEAGGRICGCAVGCAGARPPGILLDLVVPCFYICQGRRAGSMVVRCGGCRMQAGIAVHVDCRGIWNGRVSVWFGFVSAESGHCGLCGMYRRAQVTAHAACRCPPLAVRTAVSHGGRTGEPVGTPLGSTGHTPVRGPRRPQPV